MEDSPKPPLKVAIVGKAPSSQQHAPYGDPSWEIWSLSNAYQEIPRWSRWFELHNLHDGKERWPAWFWKWICTDHGKPLYIQAPHPEVPHGIVYPLQEVLGRFGTYYTNSISYMISLAILEGATDIALFGVDMAQADRSQGQNGEYQHQRPSCEFHLGVAAGLGIRVSVHENSDLLKCSRLYAFDSDGGQMRRKLRVRRDELRGRIKDIDKQLNAAKALEQQRLVLLGALEDTEDYWSQWVPEEYWNILGGGNELQRTPKSQA